MLTRVGWLIGYLLLGLLTGLMVWWIEPLLRKRERPVTTPIWILCVLAGLVWPLGCLYIARGYLRDFRDAYWKPRL